MVDNDRRLDAGHKKEIDQFEGQSEGEKDEGGEEEQDGWYPQNTGEDESDHEYQVRETEEAKKHHL